MKHDINLNIHYTIPEDLWKKVFEVFCSMPYWNGDKYNYNNGLMWTGDGIELYYSFEPGGIQITGKMPYEIWRKWYPDLKRKLTDVLGYEIGEPEEGYDFKYWN